MELILYFKVHHPRRLRRYNIDDPSHFFSDFIKRSGQDIRAGYFNDELNEQLFRKAVPVYCQSNELVLKLLQQYPNLRLCFYISGAALRQAERYQEQSFFDGFKALLDTGRVELLGGTYYHSLAGLFRDPEKRELGREVRMHRERLRHFFGVDPTTFVNSDLIYYDDIGKAVRQLGFSVLVTEGLDTDSFPHAVNEIKDRGLKVILRDWRLSDQLIYFRQSPLTAIQYAEKVGAIEGELALVGMDYQTFAGLVEDPATGFREFIGILPGLLAEKQVPLVLPREAVSRLPVRGTLVVPREHARSWTRLKNLDVYLKDHWQRNVFELLQVAEQAVREKKTRDVYRVIFGNLLTSDNFDYMAEKRQDREVIGSFHRIVQDFTTKASINYLHAAVKRKARRIKVLSIGPEMRDLPPELGKIAVDLYMDGGGLGEVHSTIFRKGFESDKYLFYAGFPDLRRSGNKEWTIEHSLTKSERVFLATHAEFYNLRQLYRVPTEKVADMALIFQKDMIDAIEQVRPDIVHFHDWPCGLLPGYVKYLNDGLKRKIKVLSTIHNVHSREVNREHIINRGLPFDQFADKLYREGHFGHWVYLLPSMIFASDFVNTVSYSFLQELLHGWHGTDVRVVNQLQHKAAAHCAFGILNAPDDSFNPQTDPCLVARFGPDTTHLTRARRENKRQLQLRLGLRPDPDAVLAFWPSRLDRHQKGIDLVFDKLEALVKYYHAQKLQFAFVADEVGTGWECSGIIDRIRYDGGIREWVGLHTYDKRLSRLGYAAADIVLVPSRYAPCELPQMVGTRYGAFPVARNTGGLHDTVFEMNVDQETGNGFLFDTYDSDGLWWAMSNALRFLALPPAVVEAQRRRVMRQSRRHNPDQTVSKYFMLYDLLCDENRFRIYQQDPAYRQQWTADFYRLQ